MPVHCLKVLFPKSSKKFGVQDSIVGKLEIQCINESPHGELTIALKGFTRCTQSTSVIVYQQKKNIPLPETLPSGASHYNFAFALSDNHNFSFQGLHVHLIFQVSAQLSQKSNKKIEDSCEIFLCDLNLLPWQIGSCKSPVSFVMNRLGLRTKTPVLLQEMATFLKDIGNFMLSGSLDSTQLERGEALKGRFTLAECGLPARSIELELCREEEWNMSQGGMTQSSSVIYAFQLADSDVCRGLEIPIYVIPPPIYTCPNFSIPGVCRVNFEVHFVVHFLGNYPSVYEKIPIVMK
jgi:hypothetical protein